MRIWHLILIIIILGSVQRCATVKSPTGGPKDTIPPVLESAQPANNSKNFRGKIVTLEFDEYVKLKDPKEVIITPRPGKDISILAKNNSITIEPKNGWLDSTTYSINFREAVQDITESNPSRNLKIAFSTGPVIDSLSISGSIKLAEKETIPEKITVAIYQADTFNIFKHTPSYFTETTKTGSFRLDNLKPGRYHLYAFDDKNKNLKVDTQSEIFGYVSDSINLRSDQEKLLISLTKIDSRSLKLTNLRHNVKLTKIKFNKGTATYHLTSPTGLHPINNYGDNQSEIDIYHWPELKDSAALKITAIDSLGSKLDTTIYVKFSTAKTIKEKFNITIKSTSFSAENNQLQFTLAYTLPLKRIEQDTTVIRIDSTTSIFIHPEDFAIDSIRKSATVTCFVNKKMRETSTSPLSIYINKGVFISIEDDSSKALKANIPFFKDEETGQLQVNVTTEQPHFIVQIVTADYKVQQEAKDQKKITFKNLPPGQYKIRAIIDLNANGHWDLGNYYLKKEPEPIIYLRNTLDGKFEFPLRANWEAGPYNFRL